ncbi:STM3941 family protein [Flavobacterium silvaticum]|uniref:PH domain-containing protein n=1 Tax=Flavobacterium silvaticum TaxID=1852020 RepID=A0A972FUN1_9FLAO|nr:STM3941 family protein [Flavobacterium silvaticum]NMH27920.1 hypothetical protein [Flavobacterium silvaticum]
MHQIEIPLSKLKLAKFLFFSVIFFVIGIWMIVADPQVSNPVFNNFIVKNIGAYGSLLMGVFGIYFFSSRLFEKKPGLILNDSGIIDSMTIFKFGLIPWSDIVGIYDTDVRTSMASKERFVTIGLAHPQKYIVRESNRFKRKILEANAKTFGSPIHISTNGLKIKHPELLALIRSEFEKRNNPSGRMD